MAAAAHGTTWRGRKVLVTGHTGFKGAWLVQLLHRADAVIHGYALDPPTVPSLFRAAGIEALLCRHETGDIRNAPGVARVLGETRPDVVFHLAAQSLVRRGHRDPGETFSTNIAGTVAVLDAVRRAGRPCVVIVVTSDKCYEPHPDGSPHREEDRLGGRDPYSASKAGAELVAASFRASFFPPERLGDHGIQVATVRAGNVIGGGDWADDRIVTDVVRHLVAGRPVPVRNPGAVRPWQHVIDPLVGYLTLADSMLRQPHSRWGRGWNFGPVAGDDVTVSGLVEAFIDAWGEGDWVDVHDPRAPAETATLRLSIDRTLSDLPWRPRWCPSDAIRRTAAWYRSFAAEPTSARRLCDADLAAHGGA